MNKGWVYIVSHPDLIGIIKIGYSDRDPEIRIKEFSQAGLPNDYILEYQILVDNAFELEKRVHLELTNSRHSKEWFRCTIANAINKIKFLNKGKVYAEITNGSSTEIVLCPTTGKPFSSLKMAYKAAIEQKQDDSIAYEVVEIAKGAFGLRQADKSRSKKIDIENIVEGTIKLKGQCGECNCVIDKLYNLTYFKNGTSPHNYIICEKCGNKLYFSGMTGYVYSTKIF